MVLAINLVFYLGSYSIGLSCSVLNGYVCSVLQNYAQGYNSNLIISDAKGYYCHHNF
ncbi:DUF6436 domain-containing protein [Colwellia maritima]|uniref:DUF6436 domain-containing protein n=1 Tax=Colwellia maritima TaxID=2912588 RepID=UPI003B846029